MEVFAPFRPQTPYAPGYGEYPTRPGTYMNGLGDVVMEPGSMYGQWGYGKAQSPYGSWGYGVYGLGQNGNGTTPEAGGGLEVEYGARLATQFGIPVVTGLVGVGVGLLLGYFVFGR